MADRRGLANKYPWWKFRIWSGMTAKAWFKLLRAHGFECAPSHIHRLLLVTCLTPLNSALALMQRIRFASHIERQELPRCIFIIGHWRTGTTYLHELLVQDPRMSFPRHFQCFCPEHFLISRRARRLISRMMPEKRPMDNIQLDFDSPQEDELALLASGCGSPYQMFAFPQQSDKWQHWFRPAKTGDEAWLSALKKFFKAVVYARVRTTGTMPEYLVLKSPTHTARLALLSQNFPDAMFIHLTRAPLEMFSSSLNLLTAMTTTQALKPPPDFTRAMQQLAFENHHALYRHFEDDCRCVSEDRLLSLKYEDLVERPMDIIEKIYAFLQFNLDETAKTQIAAEISTRRQYTPSSHTLSPEVAAQVKEHWKDYGRRFGYLD